MSHETCDFIACPFAVYRDSMEQAGWSFTGLNADGGQHEHRLVVPVKWHALGAGMGDYTIAGMEDAERGWRISIERKSLSDLFGTLLNGRDRFLRELDNLNRMESAHVVVEADWQQIAAYNPQHWEDKGYSEHKREAKRKSVRRSIVAWSIDFPKVHWWLMPSRVAAEAVAFRLLWKFYKRQQDK